LSKLLITLTEEIIDLYKEVNSLKTFVEIEQKKLVSFQPPEIKDDEEYIENLIYLTRTIKENLKNIKIELCYTPHLNCQKNLSILTRIKRLISGLMG